MRRKIKILEFTFIILLSTVYFSYSGAPVNAPPTVSLNTENLKNFGLDLTPTLEFTGTDPNTNSITYNIQISTVITFDSGNVLDRLSSSDVGFLNTVDSSDLDPFNSGNKVSFTVQSSDALTGGTYYWRVRGIDPPPGSNTYGSWSETRSFVIESITPANNIKQRAKIKGAKFRGKIQIK